MAKATQELKYKRLKVGHACFVCRSKKIKCDGLRPCMQCKARGRICQPSNPESQTDLAAQDSGASGQEDNESNHSNIESDEDSILFSRSTKNDEIGDESKYTESWTSNIVAASNESIRKSKNLPSFHSHLTFGSFVKWRVEPPLPLKYSCPIEMPSSDIQMHMIDLFFETRYKITPFIPKRLFYEQLRTKGPIITPLLLNAIYCVVSSYSTLKDVPKPSVFFNRAKKLLDDFLDTPRVSTVAALCLLSLYEPLPTKSKTLADQHCRSWMYSGMAFRMCLELGLNVDTPHTRNYISPEGVEFRRRVFWSCYCLDKMQSAEWERLWSLPSSLARTSLPQVLPDDDEEESLVVKTFEQKVRLSLISEEGLQVRASFSIRDDIIEEKFNLQLEQYRHKILQWQSNLPNPELWGFADYDTIEQIINEPKEPPILSYLPITYYFMLTDTLFCLPESAKRSLEHRIYASQLTKSVEVLFENPSLVIRYEFLAHCTIAAIRVHIHYLNDTDLEVSRQSWIFFNRCIKMLRKFQKHAIIPECSAVLQHLPNIFQLSKDMSAKDSSATSPVLDSSSHDYPNKSYAYQDAQTLPPQQTPPIQPSQQQHLLTAFRSTEEFTDTYRPEVPVQPMFSYRNEETMLTNSPFNNLDSFGSTIGVDFGDRRQLWEYAVQDVDQQQYGLSPTRTTASEDTLKLSSSVVDCASPRATEFTYPSLPFSQQPPQQQLKHERGPSPPLQHHQLHKLHYTASPSQPNMVPFSHNPPFQETMNNPIHQPILSQYTVHNQHTLILNQPPFSYGLPPHTPVNGTSMSAYYPN